MVPGDVANEAREVEHRSVHSRSVGKSGQQVACDEHDGLARWRRSHAEGCQRDGVGHESALHREVEAVRV